MIKCTELVGEYVKSVTYEIIYESSDTLLNKHRYVSLEFGNIYGPVTRKKDGRHNTYWIEVEGLPVCILHSGTGCDRQYAFEHTPSYDEIEL